MSRERTVVQCAGCDTPTVGYYDEAENLRIQGRVGCPNCGGTNLQEITPDDLSELDPRDTREA